MEGLKCKSSINILMIIPKNVSIIRKIYIRLYQLKIFKIFIRSANFEYANGKNDLYKISKNKFKPKKTKNLSIIKIKN